MTIRLLTPDDVVAFQALRLAALQDMPTAFGASFEEEVALPRAVFEARLAPKRDRGAFGAFEGDALVGLVALGREAMGKYAHKALVWGLYVAPAHRGRGLGRALLAQALSLARSVPDVLQVNLCVNAGNAGAIRLYTSMGFAVYGHEPGAMQVDGRLHDELHMALQLRAGGGGSAA
jgi:GNAT superfamily N-acetyltransferase